MIVIMSSAASPDDTAYVIRRAESLGLRTHVSAQRGQTIIGLLGDLPGPAPAYWSGIASILQRTGGGSTAFLLGEVSESGWWYYFPVAFALKTPLPAMGLVALAVGVGIWGKGGRGERGKWERKK